MFPSPSSRPSSPGFFNIWSLATIGIVLLIGVAVFHYRSEIRWNQSIGGFLEQAANANTVETAKPVLSQAILAIEARSLVEGNTSVFFKTPANDIGFWYRNLKAAEAELEALPEDASPLEKSNLLLKLRESLLEQKGGESQVTAPEGIDKFPHNRTFVVAWALGVLWVLPVLLLGRSS